MIFFLSISLNMCVGCSKNRLLETVLLSTHNMFWLSNKKNYFQLRTLNWGPVNDLKFYDELWNKLS